jgi:hypothetical protein
MILRSSACMRLRFAGASGFGTSMLASARFDAGSRRVPIVLQSRLSVAGRRDKLAVAIPGPIGLTSPETLGVSREGEARPLFTLMTLREGLAAHRKGDPNAFG